MIIKSLEYENFRNFRDHGIIKFSTDGKVTIIYGKNGEGKTTLHQLFQWVIYGRVQFNKTTTDRLYNLARERNLEYGTTFEVMGRVDFEHEGVLYSLTRKHSYRKGLDDSSKIGEEVSLQKRDDDYNWRRVDRPTETIEKMLPSGLADYFFFDGESMIADLRVKGKDSAGKLRKALFSMFNLDVIEAALSHIGRTDLRTTVLGKLYLSKGTIASSSEISTVKTNIENAQNKISDYTHQIKEAREEKKEKKELISSISEQIGNTKSKAEYEMQRADLKRQRDRFTDNAVNDQTQFGDAVMEMFPPLLISKAVIDAKRKLNLKVNSSNLPPGVGKRLIHYLLMTSTDTCVCGRELYDSHKDHIREYLDLLPPRSYASMYHEFTKTAERWGNGYDKEKIEGIIRRVIDNREYAFECDQKIKELDESEKNSADIEDLVVARKSAEERIEELDDAIVKLESMNEKYKLYLKKEMKRFDELTETTIANQKVSLKIEIMEDVSEYFQNRLDKASSEYSKKLQNAIQDLLNSMLTSKRSVSVSNEFAVRVTDSYDDESKSEGQFAVVSFAYIGGILKILHDDEHLSNKEYPLVLDGPFSKLDPEQRQNVVDMLPRFAPQVIVFSKDNLQTIFAEENIGRIWTIQSNDERNIAKVEEGMLWK